MKILVTGGAGFIGSHTCIELIENGHDVVIVDDLSNSSSICIDRMKQICAESVEDFSEDRIKFHKVSLLEMDKMDEIVADEKPEAVIHFAGLKAVGESVEKPLEYYNNNITGTLNLCFLMKKHGVNNIIFSSSATVYGDAKEMPVTEKTKKGTPTNPYGWTKWMIEQILTDMHVADKSKNVVLLRYFNPVGAHPTGLIGEDPKGIPNNLMPFVSQVAVGRREKLNIFGNDYDTPDGTCIRDYIHILDLAAGHRAALKLFEKEPEVRIYNLGTGTGYSVLDVVHSFEKACGREIPYVFADRRAGDIPVLYSDPTLAKEELGWEAKFGLDDMCSSSWNWQKNNPNGFEE